MRDYVLTSLPLIYVEKCILKASIILLLFYNKMEICAFIFTFVFLKPYFSLLHFYKEICKGHDAE